MGFYSENLINSERLHIYKTICSFLERWRIFLSREQNKNCDNAQISGY